MVGYIILQWFAVRLSTPLLQVNGDVNSCHHIFSMVVHNQKNVCNHKPIHHNFVFPNSNHLLCKLHSSSDFYCGNYSDSFHLTLTIRHIFGHTWHLLWYWYTVYIYIFWHVFWHSFWHVIIGEAQRLVQFSRDTRGFRGELTKFEDPEPLVFPLIITNLGWLLGKPWAIVKLEGSEQTTSLVWFSLI